MTDSLKTLPALRNCSVNLRSVMSREVPLCLLRGRNILALECGLLLVRGLVNVNIRRHSLRYARVAKGIG